MRLAWLTDIHLNFVPPKKLGVFLEEVAAQKPDAVLLGGDVDEADQVAGTLEVLVREWAVPIYFVLGNHDFYHGSIAGVRAQVADLCRRVPQLVYLSSACPIRLTETTSLVGHDGWGDGGYGDAEHTPVRLNDFTLIKELAAARGRGEMLSTIRHLGEEAADHLRSALPGAGTPELLVLTHVPPFQEAAWHEGRPSDNDWLPFFACKATGDVLLDEMRHLQPERRMLVLCGHTHGAGKCQMLPNLRVLTGGAEYGHPSLQRMIEVA